MKSIPPDSSILRRFELIFKSSVYGMILLMIVILSGCNPEASNAEKSSQSGNSVKKVSDSGTPTKSVSVDEEPADPPAPKPYEKRKEGTITFSKDIAPLLFKKCAGCHQEDEIAPFSLVTLDDFKKRGKQIVMVLESGFMPPWGPAHGYVKYKNDRSLSIDEIGIVKQWIEEGFKPGDLDSLPEIPKREGEWLLGEPDQIVTMKSPYELDADGKDLFRKFVIEVPGKGPRYVRAFEFKPVNKRVVHHARMTVDPSGWSRHLDAQDPDEGFDAMVAGEELTPEGFFPVWTPGYTSLEGIKGTAWMLPNKADFILELHLFRTGKVESIQSKIGFYYSDKPPEVRPCLVKLCSQTIDVPANDSHHIVEDTFTLPVNGTVLSVYPHAHYLCRDMKGFAILPDGTKKWLLRIKKWDFNWQDIYYLEEPVYLPKGTIIKMKYLFDNSDDNVYNPNHPPVRVRFGPRTEDEMADFFLQILTENDRDYAILHRDFAMKEDQVNIDRYLADLKYNPDDYEAHYSIGYYYSRQGKIDKAIEHYKKCIALKEDYLRVRNNLASLLMRKGQFQEAKKYYESAIRLQPDDVKAYNNLGILMARMNETYAARDYFQKAVALNPEFAEAQCNLGHTYVRLKKYKEAAEQYQKAIDLKPDYAVAIRSLQQTNQILKMQKESGK